MKSESRKVGDIGENAAQMFLMKHGYRLLEANYAKPWGEIDIICEKNKILSFVEVKTSKYFRETSFTPELRINRKKVQNLKKTCETYLSEKKLPRNQEWQIDVISVILNEDNSVREINHIENAIFDKVY